MELEQAHGLYEFAVFNKALGNEHEFGVLLKRCSGLVGELLDGDTKQDALQLGSRLLALRERPLTVQEKLLWLASKVGDFWFPLDGFHFHDSSTGEGSDKVRGLECATDTLEALADLNLDGADPSAEIDWSTEGFESLKQTGSDCSFVSCLVAMMSTGADFSQVITHTRHRFGVSFHLNGARRYTVVDGAIQSGSVISAANPRLRWPAIIEKAYLKLFDGSNFANDMYLLSGWIPEYVPIRSLTAELRRRLCKQFAAGEVRLGVGSYDRLHDLAIVDVRPNADGSDVVFTVVDPVLTYARRTQVASLNDFEILYVCHDPERFAHREQLFAMATDVTEPWKKPQFTVESTGEVWCLAERCLTEKALAGAASLNVHWKNGADKIYSLAESERGTANNTRFHLSKFTVDGAATMCLDTDRSIVSLTFYSTRELRVSKAKNAKFTKEVKGSWTPTNSGGSFLQPTFLKNPKWELQVDEGTKVDVYLSSDEVAEVMLFKEEVSAKNIVFPASYMRGTVSHRDVILLGRRFVLIPTTYEAGRSGSFSLAIRSSSSLTITELNPRLGLFTRHAQGPANGRYVLKTGRRSKMAVFVRSTARQTHTLAVGSAVYALDSPFHGQVFRMTLEPGEHPVRLEAPTATITLEVGSDTPFELLTDTDLA